MMACLRVVIRRELRLAMRQAGDTAVVVLFFVLAAVLFPFGVGPAPDILARIAPGVLWGVMSLSGLLPGLIAARLFDTLTGSAAVPGGSCTTRR
jgi:heme exporter protein B